ncbi:hypothetical protein Goklo_023416, partial [Gossypium klotzschianum]|nr:hypothetical protein [Gossypium klotzschianum]
MGYALMLWLLQLWGLKVFELLAQFSLSYQRMLGWLLELSLFRIFMARRFMILAIGDCRVLRLWKRRNDRIFKGVGDATLRVLEYARVFANDINRAHLTLATRTHPKLWVVREGLQIVKELRVPRLIVELDTLWGWVLKIRHILLEGNHCTNHLANLAQDDTDGLVYLNNPPNSISPFAAN